MVHITQATYLARLPRILQNKRPWVLLIQSKGWQCLESAHGEGGEKGLNELGRPTSLLLEPRGHIQQRPREN